MTKEEIRQQGKERFQEIKKERNQYVQEQGGFQNLLECDGLFNTYTRELIKAFAHKHSGDKVILIDYTQKEVEYTGQFIYNFEYHLIKSDLEIMILNWT